MKPGHILVGGGGMVDRRRTDNVQHKGDEPMVGS